MLGAVINTCRKIHAFKVIRKNWHAIQQEMQVYLIAVFSLAVIAICILLSILLLDKPISPVGIAWAPCLL